MDAFHLLFFSVDQFEYTRECIIFDLLGIQLYHGWIIDPQNKQLQTLRFSSYNQLVEKMLPQKHSDDENLSRESNESTSNTPWLNVISLFRFVNRTFPRRESFTADMLRYSEIE